MSHSPGWWPVQKVKVPRSPSLLYWRRLQGLIPERVLAQHHSDFWPHQIPVWSAIHSISISQTAFFLWQHFIIKYRFLEYRTCVTACTRIHLHRYLGSEVEFRLWATKVTHVIETVGLENIFKLHKIFHENYYLKVLSRKAELSPPPSMHDCLSFWLSGNYCPAQWFSKCGP